MSAQRARALLAAVLVLACSNDPYPEADDSLRVRYRASPVPPKTLDPARSYSVNEHDITANLYETLVEYHYRRPPYQLVPGLARAVPEPRALPSGGRVYEFELRPDLLFQDDPCFEHFHRGRATREIVAGDVAFQLMRIADPAVVSPIAPNLAAIEGFRAFGERLSELRQDPQLADLRIDRLYEAAGGIAGLVVEDPHRLQVVLSRPNPQLLFWFAMPFTTPVPWEAVAYWDGQEGRAAFKDHPVGNGPFRIRSFDKHRRIVLDRNPNWYGARHPEWRAPGATFPEDGIGADAAGSAEPSYAGRALPFLDRVEYRIEKALIPQFGKFSQGYYDTSLINKESFDRVVAEGGVSPALAERGIQLRTAVEPTIWYAAFNMADPVVGHAGGERSRALRQAMSLAIDAAEFTRLFYNGRGVLAHSPIPPGLFGYDPDYRNPFREPDLSRARALLAQAGYPEGLDPATGRPLALTFDALDATTERRLQFEFLTKAWGRIGLDVRIDATTYNQFRDKVDRGAHQVYMWGWHADYPDPENFLFLLWGPNGNLEHGGPNHTNFSNPRYDALFPEMRDRPDDARRLELIREMTAILERERPWIELFFREQYVLQHGWLKGYRLSGVVAPIDKYLDVDPAERARLQRIWNEPIVWPAWLLGGATVAALLPGVVTFFRERQ